VGGCATFFMFLFVTAAFIFVINGAVRARSLGPGPSTRRWRITEPTSVRIEDLLLGRPYTVETDAVFTRVVVDLRGRSPGMLKIAPPGPASRIAGMFGRQDLLVGDRAFDDRFTVMANPESLARRVFLPERRARLIASIQRIGARWAPFLDVTADQLIVGVFGGNPSARPVQDLVATAREFTEVLLEIGTATGIVWIEDAEAPGGQCQVCGSEMRERIVRCVKCRTPHHEECWRYTGECSTFACKERAYLKDGRVVRITDRRQKPDEWLREEIERDRRESGGQTFPSPEESLRRFDRRQRERGR
jgi:RING finger family protein